MNLPTMKIRQSKIALASLLVWASTMALPAQETQRRGASNEQLIDEPLRQAAARGLEWLAEHQHQDGYWA
ncbi:MAG: hypothetical protein RL398_2748, partial [Planctomycetota bacterium]